MHERQARGAAAIAQARFRNRPKLQPRETDSACASAARDPPATAHRSHMVWKAGSGSIRGPSTMLPASAERGRLGMHFPTARDPPAAAIPHGAANRMKISGFDPLGRVRCSRSKLQSTRASARRALPRPARDPSSTASAISAHSAAVRVNWKIGIQHRRHRDPISAFAGMISISDRQTGRILVRARWCAVVSALSSNRNPSDRE
jgi:hypothetical protein